MTAVPDLQRGALAALLSLPELGPARLTSLLDRFGEPLEAWQAVSRGALHDVDLRRAGPRRGALVERWRAAARALPPAEALHRHRAAGVAVLAPGDPDWPDVLLDDPEPPAALFVRGDPGLLDRVGVAVVGTRRCTAAGAEVARRFGAGLGRAGVPVVSGLAAGIDGASHVGALDAGGAPVGVVASGLDVVYPARHERLWSQVAEHGVLVSECALGVGPERWRFPARNRLIAAFGAVVVVVESPVAGGSMSTVDAAVDRQTDVVAVPGSVLSKPSGGTNQLLHEGAGVVRDADDVLALLGTDVPLVAPAAAGSSDGPTDPVLATVAEALSPTAVPIDVLATAVDLPIATVTTALARLEAAGHVRRSGAGYRRVLR